MFLCPMMTFEVAFTYNELYQQSFVSSYLSTDNIERVACNRCMQVATSAVRLPTQCIVQKYNDIQKLAGHQEIEDNWQV